MITARRDYIGWIATDDDWYDGAEDAGRLRMAGYGYTEAEAIDDLLDKMEDGAEWQQKLAAEYREQQS